MLEQSETPEESDQQRPRPRVIDKRVSSRASEPDPPAPDPPAPDPPTAEPPTPDPPTAEPRGAEPPDGASEIAQELGTVPSQDWLINIAATLANIAAAKLALGALDEAKLPIDGLTALLASVGDQLGDASAPLRDTLARLKLAFADLAAAPPEGSTSGS